ncbi:MULTISPECIES: MDR family MFS transporter [Microbacterium]|jgi:EmrB/QacA subfamily drug resistance transporter|uniref:MDR family MFS transporter n=1 Tax=Microbacterium TaxID=33882 RepID=UPI001E483355|nr:MDR family MFS transporter [Microbacterium nymphoidis]MCD2498925.1 MFS transporter [Microbacterium nymphoidis]
MSATTAPPAAPAKMTHRQVLEALSGLLLGMFVSMLASTVVSSSMPVIVSDLDGDQTDYTWVITSTMLTTAIFTPIWGKLADLTNRKLLIQIALVIFVVSSATAGFAQNPEMLIASRFVQGVGAGGLAALSQVIMADIISPRERGRYMGLFGAVMAVATVGGPLLGGFITDVANWRWNFFIAVPFAVLALILLQTTLHLPKQPRRKVSIDYLGIVFLAVSVSLLLIWVTEAGTQFEWASAETAWMTSIAGAAAIAFVVTELLVKEPLIPLSLFRNRTFTLSVIASISIGVAMFGTSVYLSQYMQMSRGATPTEAGLMSIPMMAGVLVSSMVIGQIITRTGKWKRWVVLGSIMLLAGITMLATIRYDTNYWLLSVYMFLTGAGVGMAMQNLVLVVQNTARPQEMGAASSGVAFFRSLGGTVGVSVMGAIVASSVTTLFTDNKQRLTDAITEVAKSAGPEAAKKISDIMTSGKLPVVHELPNPFRGVLEDLYAQAISHSFIIGIPLAAIAVLAIVFLPNISLTRQTTTERLAEDEAGMVAVATGMATTGPIPVITGATPTAASASEASRSSRSDSPRE